MLTCDDGPMVIATGAPPVVLIAAAQEHSLAGLLDIDRYAVIEARSGTLALEWARDLQPDTIILDADLPDISGIDVCRLLHGDLRIGHSVPILILAADKPSPEQRVSALRAGAWDFLRYPRDPDELSLQLQTYVQAKRNIDVALVEELIDPTTGLHSRTALARRARELGALMARKHGALACVVFALETDSTDPKAGTLVARAARLSDVVGALTPTEFAVLAPATDPPGALKLAQRVAGALRGTIIGGDVLVPGSTLRAGYDAVANLTYSPIDPVELLPRATAAVRYGTPEPGYPWVRRLESSLASGRNRSATSRSTLPLALVSDKGRTSP